MPFQSEKQRRYLWANEPEIARDWTDTYGSGIAKALGGRIGFYKGSDRHAGTGSSQSQASSGKSHDRGGQRHRAAAAASHAPTTAAHHPGESSGREQAIADRTYTRPDQLSITRGGQHIGTGPLTQHYNKNLRTLALQDQYRQGAYQRAHPFLSKVKSGLGSLGRGIGQVARNFNPLSFAFENPLMKLLMSGYGGTNIRNLFPRNNQNINWKDPDQAEDTAWENVNYNPNALTRLQMEQGIMTPDILPEQNYDNMFDNTYLADVSRGQYNTLKSLGQVGNTGGSVDEIKKLVPEGTFDSITDDEWKMIFKGEPFKAFG